MCLSKDLNPDSTCATLICNLDATIAHATVEFTSPATITSLGTN